MKDELERIWKEVVAYFLTYYNGICLEGLWKVTSSLSQDSRSQRRDLNKEPAESYKEIQMHTSPPVVHV
jgi:hypothetical protein